MEMKFMRFIPFFLFFLNPAGESDVIGSNQTVKATVGQDVILPCHLEPSSDMSTQIVEWEYNKTIIVHVYRSGGDYLVDQDEKYKDRTSLFHEEMTRGNISLKLTKVTELDEGSYTCYVPRLDSQVRRGRVILIVDESRVIGSHEPVKVTVGQDVILPCHLEPPSDVSTLTVEWEQDAKQVHLYRSGANHLVGQDEIYKNRTSLFHEEMTRGNISLKLTNVTELDEGSYTCYVPRLDSQVRRGKVILIVESEDDEEKGRHTNNTSDGPGLSTGGIIGIVIAGLVKIGLFVRKKCRNPECRRRQAGRQEDKKDDNQDAIALNDRGDNTDN